MNLSFSRSLATVAITNYAVLVIANLLQLPVAWTSAVYLLCMAASGYAMSTLKLRRGGHKPRSSLLLLGLLSLLLLTIPRLVYLSEWLPENTVLLQFDDYARVAELVAMTLSDQYPLRHPSTDAWLLSYYYASLYPMVVLKQCLPFLTLKDCVVLGSLLYHALIIGALLEIALRTLPRAGQWPFLFLCTLFAGLDSLALTANPWFGHDEWWAQPWLGGFYQVSSPYTTLFWTPQHALGALLPLVAILLYRCATLAHSKRRDVIILLLLLSAVYTSPFAVLPALICGLLYWRALLRRLWQQRYLRPVLLSAVAPAFLFMNRVQQASFELSPVSLGWSEFAWLDLPLSILAYLVAISVVDMAGLPILAWVLWPKLSRRQRQVLLGLSVFFLSTALIYSQGFNNYTMRGMPLVLLGFSWLVARHLPWQLISNQPSIRIAGLLTVVVLAFPTLRESAANTRILLLNSRLWYEWQNQKTPRYIRSEYRELARDNKDLYFIPFQPTYHGLRKFNAEKLLNSKPTELERWEKEIARHSLTPRGKDSP